MEAPVRAVGQEETEPLSTTATRLITLIMLLQRRPNQKAGELARAVVVADGLRKRYGDLALINRPEVVFLDELTTGLDPQGRRAAWDLVREIRTGGATVVLTTHFMDEADGDLNAATLGVLDGVRRVARDGERVII